MNSQMRKQIIIGLLVGLFITLLVIIFLSGKRDELKGLESQNTALQADVHKGIQLKANAEKLKLEVEQQQKLIDELIKLMPTEEDRAEIFYKIKKVADNAGIDQIEAKSESKLASSGPYYTEYPTTFRFRGDFHSFGQFASLISGYEKTITLSEIHMYHEKDTAGIYPVQVSCKISAFVYNPEPSDAASTNASKRQAPAKNAAVKGED